jgi:uroporphyrinogen decarboxylase
MENSFLTSLKRNKTENKIPLYCTGYPEEKFIRIYKRKYGLKTTNSQMVLNGKDYSLIKGIGFDAVSLWEYRRGEGGYLIEDSRRNLRVDGWGRIYHKDWYTWKGCFTNEETLENWTHLTLPSKKKLKKLKEFLYKNEDTFNYVLSIPGLFEKTWQSMGFVLFSKSIKNNQKIISSVIEFFQNYLFKLITVLKEAGASVFLFADDIGYKRRTFIQKSLWDQFFQKPYKELVDYIKKDNHYIILHSDGFISNMIESFIEIGFDAIQGLEPNAGVDIFSLFKTYGSDICFIGNVDVSTHLTFGKKEDVAQYIAKLKKYAREYNAFLIVSPTQQIHSKVKPQNLKTMINATKED